MESKAFFERQVSDTFAFTFSQALGIECEIINVTTLVFQVLDSRVTPTTPLVEILNNPSQNLGVFNVTTGQSYDLTGVQIISYNEFQLSTAVPQPTTFLDDIITADYRFETVNQFVFTLQPVISVTSVVGNLWTPDADQQHRRWRQLHVVPGGRPSAQWELYHRQELPFGSAVQRTP